MVRRLLASPLLIAFAMVAPAAAQTGYHLVKTITLPGDKGGHGDWTLFDADTRTVWLSQTPDHNVVVLDADGLGVKHIVADIQDGNNIVFTPDYAFLADNAGGVMVVLDKRSFAPVARVLLPGAQSTRSVYDPAGGALVVATGAGDAVVVAATPPFAVRSQSRLQPDPAKDGADVGLYVASLGRVYKPVDGGVNVIDPVSAKVVDIWQPAITGRVKPMVYDAATRRFLAGTTDRKMLVMDGDGTVLASIPVAGAVDQTAIDEGLRRAYVGDKAGRIEVIDLDRMAVVDALPSEPDVHTLAVDLQTHRVFVYRNVSNVVDVFEPAP